MNKMLMFLTTMFAVLIGTANAEAGFTYVGSWDMADLNGNGSVSDENVASNPWYWVNNPAVLSAREAAAMLFGGSYTDYAISTVDSSVANINFKAFVDGWGDTTYFSSPAGAIC